MPVHSKKAEFKWKVPEEAKHSLCFFFWRTDTIQWGQTRCFRARK